MNLFHILFLCVSESFFSSFRWLSTALHISKTHICWYCVSLHILRNWICICCSTFIPFLISQLYYWSPLSDLQFPMLVISEFRSENCPVPHLCLSEHVSLWNSVLPRVLQTFSSALCLVIFALRFRIFIHIES